MSIFTQILQLDMTLGSLLVLRRLRTELVSSSGILPKSPKWFQDELSAAVQNGDDLSHLRQYILNATKNIVARYKGKNTNYKGEEIAMNIVL